MRAYRCQVCEHPLFFENSRCTSCGTALAYAREERAIVPVDADGVHRAADGTVRHRCRNLDLSGCTWLAPEPGGQCSACDLTRTRPADTDPEGLAQLPAAEAAKRHLVAQLDGLGLPLVDRGRDPERGLAVDMLSSSAASGAGPVVIGHADGVVTLDLAETDDARRERIRAELGEPYRTMLGHLRHEVGHYAQWVLLAPGVDDAALERCRALFGDERADYQAALDRHYADGPPEGWEDSYVTTYATMHPFEDFAETWAHVLHVLDTVETATEHGLVVPDPASVAAGPVGFRDLVVDTWMPLAVALNQVNRSMGKDDLYPFVLPATVLDKLAFVAGLLRRDMMPPPGG